MDTMEKVQAKQVMDSMAKVAQEVAQKHGVDVERVRASYGVDNVTVTIRFAHHGGKADTWRTFCSAYGLEPDDFGREVTIYEQRYRLEGFNARSDKCPIEVIEVATGRRFRFPAWKIRNVLGRPLSMTPDEQKRAMAEITSRSGR